MTIRRKLLRLRAIVRNMEGSGKAPDRKAKRRHERISSLLIETHPEPFVEPIFSFFGPDEGWLHQGMTEGGYSTLPLWLGLNPQERRDLIASGKIQRDCMQTIVLRNSKPGWPPHYDGTEDLDRTRRAVTQLREETGAKIALSGASDHDARQLGLAGTMAGLVDAVEALDGLVDCAFPANELDKFTDRAGAKRMAELWPFEDIPLLLWLTPELYWNLSDHYDGIAWQDKDIGDDGVTIRSPEVRYSYLMNNDPYHGPQDLTVGSPARSAREHGWHFIYFEAAVPEHMTAAEALAIYEQARRALSDLGMPEYTG